MTIIIKDVNGSGRIVNEIAAALASYSSYSGYNSLILQLNADDKGMIEDLLYKEGTTGGSDGYYSENGIDALLSEASLNAISKETFYSSVKAFTKNRRCDVAQASRKENFYDTLKTSASEFKTLLTSAKAAYDFIFIPLRSKSEKELFGEAVDEIMELFDVYIRLARQGSVDPVKDHYPREAFVLTGYKPESKYTVRTMARRLNIGKAPLFPLSVPTEYRDAIDDGRLLTYIRTAKSNENDPCAGSCLWSKEINDIIAYFGKNKVRTSVDVWSEVEFDDDED